VHIASKLIQSWYARTYSQANVEEFLPHVAISLRYDQWVSASCSKEKSKSQSEFHSL
jgi:hypothetical protein